MEEFAALDAEGAASVTGGLRLTIALRGASRGYDVTAQTLAANSGT